MKHIIFATFAAALLAGCSGNDVDFEPVTFSDFVTGSTGNSDSGVPLGQGDTDGQVDSGGGINTDVASDDDRDTNTMGFVAGDLTAVHRNGQTFLVWSESGAGVDYHVYRHTSPINSGNINAAQRLTDRWGPLGQNTSVNRNATDDAPANFVISDGGQPLADDQGLFVHTTSGSQQGGAYYAVTSVVGGREDLTVIAGNNATTEPVNEFSSTPRPVQIVSENGGRGRIYTQFMDYSQWNPTHSGYAYNFAVALPADYDPQRRYALRMTLHAFGESHKFVEQTEFDWPVIQLFPSDPGTRFGTVHSWWYGYARDHNYRTQGSIPRSGAIENFTEQRVLASIDFLINDSQFSIDSDLTHVYGHSMGGSGSLTYGMRYPSVFAGIYASEPMTNYATSPEFQDNFVSLWGTRDTNLPIVNNGRNNSAISDYDSNGSQPTRVWDWMNHQQQLINRRGDRFSYLMVDHGKDDRVIDWQTQGRPMAGVFTQARAGFSAAAVGGVGHNWLGFRSLVRNVFGFGFDDPQGWRYPKTLSFPGIHNSTGSGSLQPLNNGDDLHNTTIEWATPINNFHQSIVDSENAYEITFRSTALNQTADITPRNTNAFRPAVGATCSWSARDISNNRSVGSGNSTVDSDRLLTIRSVLILAASGTRLQISCP